MFCQILSAFLKFTLNSEHFQKKDERHNLCVSKIIDGKKRAKNMSKESFFSTP